MSDQVVFSADCEVKKHPRVAQDLSWVVMDPKAIEDLKKIIEAELRSSVDDQDPNEGGAIHLGQRYLWRAGITREEARSLAEEEWSASREEQLHRKAWNFRIYYTFRKGAPILRRPCQFFVVMIAKVDQIGFHWGSLTGL